MEQGTRQATAGHGTTASPGAKFAIGALAGAAAVLLPRLLALLSKSDDAQQALQDAHKLQARIPTARAKKLDQQLKPVLVEVKP